MTRDEEFSYLRELRDNAPLEAPEQSRGYMAALEAHCLDLASRVETRPYEDPWEGYTRADPLAVMVIDRSGRILSHNDEAAERLLPPASRGFVYLPSLIEDADRQACEGLLLQCLDTEQCGQRDLKVHWADGHVGFARVSARKQGATERIRVTLTDIDDLKTTENRLDADSRSNRALLRESTHRIKNLLQIVRSSIEIKARTAESPDARRIATTLRTQVAALQGAFGALSRGSNVESANALLLVEELVGYLAITAPDSISIAVHNSTRVLTLDAEASTSLSLAVAELCLNAIEHAFPEDRAGTVEVRLDTTDDGRAVVDVRDDGIGFEGAPAKTGSLGLIIVRDLVEGHLHGSIEWLPEHPGTTARITFPIPCTVER